MLFPPYSVRRLEGGEQLVARERHLCHPHTDRVVDRVDDRRRRRTHGRLAQSVASERAVRLSPLDDDHLGERRALHPKRKIGRAPSRPTLSPPPPPPPPP